jgi:TrkA-N domain/Ion channel
MNNQHILILGSGHLAYRVKKLALTKGYKTISIPKEVFQLKDTDSSTFDSIANVLQNTDLSALSMTYLLDDSDEFNLQLIIVLMSLCKNLRITASLFNENIATHLSAGHPNLLILNPAKIAAPAFAEALEQPVTRQPNYAVVNPIKQKENFQLYSLINILLFSFVLVITLATLYFHFAESLSFLDALYFVVVTISTVGYGDINLLNASPVSKLIGILLILSSTIFIWMIFSLTIDRVIKKRVQLSLGRKKYTYKNHIILCGLGRLGHFIATELLKRGEKIVIIESNETSADIDYFRSLGADVYIGNAKLAHVLQDVGVIQAQAVIAVVNDDFANLEIGLNARSFQPNLRLILRIFDESMAQKIKENLDIHLTLSMSALADDKFLNAVG